MAFHNGNNDIGAVLLLSVHNHAKYSIIILHYVIKLYMKDGSYYG